jgi:alkylhydroperoxidase family enzyme
MAFVETGGGEGTNFDRLFELRPQAYAAWRALNGAIKETMPQRRYELATMAAAGRLRSTYCMLAHGSVLLREGIVDGGTLRALVDDHRHAGLDPAEVAVMDLARKVVDDATSVTEADVERLRQSGLADDEILDVVLAAAARCFFSKTLDALGVQADAGYRELEPELREALTVGRPIADA